VRIALLVTVLLTLAALPAYSDALYRWTDDQGQVHMTTDPKRIPVRYRSSVRERKYSSPPAAPLAPSAPPASPAPGNQSKPGSRHSVPIEYSGGQIRVQATLNGEVQVPIVVDTGASVNTIPRSVAEQIGIPLGPEVRTMLVSGVSGIPMLQPLVELDQVNVGGAVVEHMPFTITDTLEEGLLGMPYLRHFRVEIQSADGVMLLQKIDLSRVEGIQYGGHPETYWRQAFQSMREQLLKIEKARKGIPPWSQKRKGLDEAEQSLRQAYDRLETAAIASGVPRSWRE
jgi:clan AA aspartic protease (TIGR02281 family)